ncbi:MAG TPA: hypothetical protein VMU75_06380 [Acidimicrobiales bacterium]|nr:hypothetical protein [Acidimicrobiales bacterium]
MLLDRVERADCRALALLAGTPVVLMAAAALAGYPLLTGDDVIQNYPLRALVGEILRHGHLPVLDPYAWAGTPLLGGINAGAAFPANWLFVLLPSLSAWVLTEGLAYAAAAVGLYAFLRGNRLPPLPASLGAAAYGLAGFLASQAVHLDVVQTGAALAWLLVALDRIAHGRDHLRPAYCALLAVSVGCVGLAGSPEAAFDAVVAAVLYSLHLLLHDRRRVRTGGYFLLGAVLGTLVAAVQILPGDRFVAISQRSSGSLAFLGAGGVSPFHLLYLLAPHILGGGPIGLAPYVGRYDLGELDGYPSIASLVALGALAARWRSPGASRWRVWYLIGLVGLVTALGGVTPLPRLLGHLPVIGLSRLPSRALLLFGLSCAVLLAHWAADVLEPRAATPGGAPGGRAAGGGRGEAVAGTLLPTMVLALVAAVAIGGVPVAREIGGQPTGPWSVARVMPYLAPAAALAVAAAWFAVAWPRLRPRARTAALVAIVLCDLVLSTVNQSSFAPVRVSRVESPNVLSGALARVVGPSGRFLVVDPGRLGGAALDQVGPPNLNVFTGVASAQGYGSLTWGPYAAATGTHGQDVADADAIAGTTFDALDVRALLALPGSFQAPAPSGPVELAARAATSRYFGQRVHVAAVELDTPSPPSEPAGGLARLARRVRLLEAATGRPVAAAPVVVPGSGGRITLRFGGSPAAGGLELPPSTGQVASVRVVVRTSDGATFSPTGPLAAAASGPHWRPAGTIGPYAVLVDTRARGLFSFLPAGPGAAAPGTARVVASSPYTPTERVAVRSARAAVLVWSEAALPGWRALVAAGGRASAAPVRRAGLVQEVDVPAGRSEVTFTYTAPGLTLGLWLAAVGCAGIVALLALGMRCSRRAHAAAGHRP